MTCKCKECGRKYTYDDEVGYSRDICGPYCDGRHSQVAEISRLRALLGEADKRLLRAADVLVFGLAAGGTEPLVEAAEELQKAEPGRMTPKWMSRYQDAVTKLLDAALALNLEVPR